jgi:RNA:NAD 2'-phosphotransferase (TPT1/KptA family)
MPPPFRFERDSVGQKDASGEAMDEEKIRAIVNAMTFDNGKWEMGIDAIAAVQPGLARIMPEIGTRTWKLYYAAKARNWENAMYQWKETKGLFELGAFPWIHVSPRVRRHKLQLDRRALRQVGAFIADEVNRVLLTETNPSSRCKDCRLAKKASMPR